MRSEFAKTAIDFSEVIERIREHWLSNLAHNLSNPAFAARGYLRMTVNETRTLPENEKRYLTLALENIDKLVTLVRGLEDFPAMRNFDFSSFSIRDVIEELLHQMGPLLADRNTRVRKHFLPEPITTIGDRAKLTRAMADFLDAAAPFAAPNGFLDISERMADGYVAVLVNAGSAQPSSASLPDLSLPDLERAAGLWQLHGGRVRADRCDEGYSLVCELPVVWPPQQKGAGYRED